MIVIDASKGGTDEGKKGNGIVEKDFTLLISKYIYDRLKELGADVKLVRTSDETISDSNRAIRVVNAYGDNKNVIAISNILNSGGLNGTEIVYALRNSDNLALKIANSLENSGIKVNKYYQKRSDQDTSKDYYPIQRNTGQIQTIVIDYGYVDNLSDATNLKNNYKKYGEAVVKAIAEYKGLKYYPVDNKYEVYIVQKGDSLYSIATKNNTTVDEIKRLNNLTSNLLSIGQQLVV